MTREEAIKTLRELWSETNDPWYEEVYNMAIEALEAKTDGDLIGRQDAIEAVRKLKIVEDKNFPDYAYNAGIETAIKTIEVMLSADAEEYIKECNTNTHDLVYRPSADAVEVVRCIECRHSRIEGDTTMFMWCGYWNKPTDGIRYCSDGERR